MHNYMGWIVGKFPLITIIWIKKCNYYIMSKGITYKFTEQLLIYVRVYRIYRGHIDIRERFYYQ